MDLSIVIPARNESENLATTLNRLAEVLRPLKIMYEILVVDDHSTDKTKLKLASLKKLIPQIKYVANEYPNGYGYTVRFGLEAAVGDAVVVYMADGSDSPADLVKFYNTLHQKKVDCVFGSRFIKGSKLVDYPRHKYLLNRLANTFIQITFGIKYNDVTNAFKIYRRSTLQNLMPFLSCHFNLTVELPLKAIVRGHSYAVVPNSWVNRKFGISNLKINEMGSRYLFIIAYCFLEKWLSRGDYKKSKAIVKSIQSKKKIAA